MTWLNTALVAYLLNAIAFIVDKYLLASPIVKPLSYAFWVGILSMAVLVLWPFGVFWISWQYFLIAFLSGAAFFLALIFLYRGIQKTEITVASTKVGSLSIIFTYFFSTLILKDPISFSSFLAIGLMLLGIVFIGAPAENIWKDSLAAGAIFGISLVLLKWLFENSSFINGFFWSRIGLVGLALIMLAFSRTRKEISNSLKRSSDTSKFIFTFNKMIAGTGFLLLYFAIKIGNVSIVNALLGVQFAFILIFALILGRFFPVISQGLDIKYLPRKLIGIGFVALGLVVLFR